MKFIKSLKIISIYTKKIYPKIHGDVKYRVPQGNNYNFVLYI